MKKNLLTFGIILLSALNIHSQSVNVITPNAGIQGQTLSVSISGTNMNFGNQWSGLSDFRFSQFSGLNMFYGIPTGTIATSASASDLYGDISISTSQNLGWYDLEVYNQSTGQWVQRNNAFLVLLPTTASWNCISPGNCQDPGTGNGQYSTQAACISACAATPSWDCISVGNCQDPGTGNGQYSTQAACISACVATPSWNCTNGICIDPGTGQGQYATQAACQSNCVAVTYDCINNACIDPGTGNGTYASLTACQSNCVITPTWDCDGQGNCNDPGTGAGAYASLSACETECDSSTSIISQEIEYLNIYPNPTNGILNIQFSILNSQDIILNLVNTVGEVIFTERLSNYIGEYNKQINLESYSKAIYFLEIKTDNGIVNKKLILQ